eukprot:2700664-Pleurochrysis_carterae.AAC.5
MGAVIPLEKWCIGLAKCTHLSIQAGQPVDSALSLAGMLMLWGFSRYARRGCRFPKILSYYRCQ